MWSDTESDKDYLNFGEVSQLAVDILTADGMLPVSVGVFGNWGGRQILATEADRGEAGAG